MSSVPVIEEVLSIELNETALRDARYNTALLDSGCSWTVCGKRWLEVYKQTLGKKQLENVTALQKSERLFKFGDGNMIKSSGSISVPVYFGKWLNLHMDVVEIDLPLLLSRRFMEESNTKIGFQNSDVSIFGIKQKIIKSSNGHLCIPLVKSMILDDEGNTIYPVFFSETLKNRSDQELKKIAKKLHQQFGHCNSKRLIKLLQKSDFHEKKFFEIIEKCEETCEICQMSRRAPTRPVVALGRASHFNDSVAIDLKFFDKKIVLHMIDEFTRYSRCIVIRNKEAETVVGGIIQGWISIFGTCKQFLHDNGLEFNNELLRNVGDKFSINIKSTAGYSPFSNGVNEKHNDLIGLMIEKLMSDGYSLENATCWAVSAKNALANVNGYSPNQLVFGKNPNYPSVLTSDLPGLEEWNNSDILRENLNLMHESRREFIKLESDERLKRAFKRQTRNIVPARSYVLGDKVYFHKNNAWCGPGVVYGIDNNELLVKQGSHKYRIHPCKVKRVVEDVEEIETSDANNTVESTNRGDDFVVRPEFNSDEIQEEELRALPVTQNSNKVSEDVTELVEPVSEDVTVRTEEENVDEEAPNGVEELYPFDSCKYPTKNDYVECVFGDTVRRYRVISKGKSGSARERWVNVSEDGEDCAPKGIDWLDVEKWKRIPEEALITFDPRDPEMMAAQLTELEHWKKHDVYEEIEKTNEDCITTQWVYSQKYVDGKRIVKARLVARGFQEKDESIRSDSPCTTKESVRLLLIVASHKRWKTSTIDIKSAFLQGEKIDRRVILKPPKCVKTNKTWLLKKCVYGLRDASRKWYLKLDEALTQLGLGKMSLDEGVYVWRKNGEFKGMVCLHVDDLMYTGDLEFRSQVIAALKKTFLISTEGEEKFKYLGLQIKQKPDGSIMVDQTHYIKSLEEPNIDMNMRRRKDDPLSDDEKKELKRFAGQLAWAGNICHPEVCFDARMASQNIEKATVSDVMQATKVLRRMKNEPVTIKFIPLRDIKKCKLVVYCDASNPKKGEVTSQEGHVIFLVDELGTANVIRWCSKKISRVVPSTLAAESLAMMTAVETAYYYKEIIERIFGLKDALKIVCFSDSRSLVDHLGSTKKALDHRLRIDIARIKEMLADRELDSVTWVRTEDQLADCFTKTGASCKNLLRVIAQNSLKYY